MDNFRQCLVDCELRDLPPPGDQFTWHGNRRGTLIWERLDWFLCNSSFDSLFSSVDTQNLDWIYSDYKPIKIRVDSQRPKRQRKQRNQFKFEEFWTNYNECADLIAQNGSWNGDFFPFSSLSNNLHRCSKALSNWGRDLNNKRKNRIRDCKTALRDAYTNISSVDFDRIHGIEFELDKLLEEEEIYWKQMSREDWLKWGDKNSCLINGEKKGRFYSSRGLHQGDPLSPYLFLIVTEGLSHLISRANNRGSISGFVCNNGPTISHLLFADDSLIFCRAEENELVALKDLINVFESVSGEAINYSKSAILFSPKLDKDKRCFLSNILGVNQVNDFGKYLGVPSVLTNTKSRDFNFVLEKIWKSVQGWKRSLFSIGSKDILIKSIGQAIPSYMMSVFKFPKKPCDRIMKC